MFCKKCGNQLSDDAKFCKKCGNRVNSTIEDKLEQKIIKEEKKTDISLAKSDESKQKNMDEDEKIIDSKNKKKNKKSGHGCLSVILKILFGFVLIVLTFLGLIYMGFFSDDSDDNTSVITNEQSEEKKLTLEERKEEVREQLKTEEEPIDIEFDDADEYYKNNSEVIATIDADKSEKVPTENEVIEIFEERGFADSDILTEYSMDGEYSNEYGISGTSEKHPVYYTYYIAANNELWTITVTNGCVTGYPVIFNSKLGYNAEVIISETETITAYDSVTNKFYETIPYDSTLIVKVIKRIDAETLDNLTIEVVSENEETVE